MKKLLMLLGSISIIVGSVSTVIACDNPTSIAQSTFENAIKREIEQANRITTQKEADQYNKDFNDGKIKIEDVIIKLNYIAPTHDQSGSFNVVFTPSVRGKYNQAKEIQSSRNVIEYDVQAAFEAAIAEELNYANEIKTRSAADKYKRPSIKDVDITNDYTTPLPNATSKFQAAFNPKPTGIYKDATSRSSNANIIEFEDPAIQIAFEKKIESEKNRANDIKTQKQAEEYKAGIIPDVKIELIYTKPDPKPTHGSFYVIFHPTFGGEYHGAKSLPSNKNRFEYDHQIYFEKAIDSAMKSAEQVLNRKDAQNYTPPIIEGVDIEKKYKDPTLQIPGSFQVTFTPTANGIYKEAKSKQTNPVQIEYIAIHTQEYLDAIKSMQAEYYAMSNEYQVRTFWLSYFGTIEGWNDHAKSGWNDTKIPGVEVSCTIYSTNLPGQEFGKGKEIQIQFSPIKNGIYSDIGTKVWDSRTVCW
ncbi:lipoprotein [Williamsoniiplasma luminosum]|uniref:Lipoprotein n=1 Tax=Williamsoniiplasma luminosum TaxID=214888 RepID=A0A2S0NJK1_9MOLU|nr:lipoprotein [Williamsoniiplasma luminosum]AVP49185.1 MAG: hypothetical protein C5T88_01125 [Williamsoniiplasma luminosum]